MVSQLPFDVLFNNLLFNLKSSNKVVKISSHFDPHKDVKNMFKYVWDLEEVHSFIQITPTGLMKDDKKSENLRKEGNNYYQKKMLLSALDFYNKSILHSPQYDFANILNCNSENYPINYLTEHLKQTDSKNLAYAYANRAAVLFELRKYEECVLDIKRSIECGYPTLLRAKLVEREARCYLAQNQKEKAKSVLKDGLIFVKNLDINEEKTMNLCYNIEDLLHKCETEDFMEENSFPLGNETLQNMYIPEVPVLPNSRQEIPSLSNAVSLSYSSERGRYLVADRDIIPGEILISERCFSSIILPSSLVSHCSYCLRRVYNPVPCPYCSSVAFCTEECLSKGLNQYHNTECCILPCLIALELGKNSMLAFRLIVQIPITELKSKVYQYLDDEMDAMHLGFNERNVYSSEDYRTIYHLVTNKEKRSVSDLFKRSVMAACMVKLLLKTNYFGHSYQNLTDINSSDMENIYFVGLVLFTHLMNLPCNAHSITELMVNTKKYQESYMEEIGAGAFGVLSLTNHSCNPSLARSCYGQTIVAKAIKFIPRGSEIFDSYGEHFAIHNKETRQIYLSQQYYFKCTCEACLQNWCSYHDLPDNIQINCVTCLNAIPLQASVCANCNKFTTDIEGLGEEQGRTTHNMLENIQKAVKLYRTSYEYVLKGNLSQKNLGNILNVIYFLSKYGRMPMKLLFEAQETLKHCFDREGSHCNL